MKYAIIAAGEGSRLAAEGVKDPKPLVKVGRERLIDRLLRIFAEQNAEQIAVICNDRTTLVSQHLVEIEQDGLAGRPLPLTFTVKSTPSSMHSFSELERFLNDSNFVLTTVDTIFREEEFKAYTDAFAKALSEGYDGLFGVTDYIDDESPLYVDTDDDDNILGFLDQQNGHCRYISGGIYGLTPTAFATLHSCLERGESRMRNFQRGLIRDGLRLKAFRFSKVLDIDHASDIKKAEEFICY